MLAEFFSKRIIRTFSCVIAVTFVLICTGYAFALSRVKRVPFEWNVYFLVNQGMAVEAGAEFIKWNGGAGYLIEREGERYAAIHVFFDRSSAENVQNRLTESGQGASIISIGTHALYFKGNEKGHGELYVKALKLLKSYVYLVEDCIVRLENGMSQEACIRILKTITSQFKHAKTVYANYPQFGAVCKETVRELQSICCGTVYLKDLRFLLCYQTDSLIDLCSNFSI